MELSFFLQILLIIFIILFFLSFLQCYGSDPCTFTIEHFEERMGGTQSSNAEDRYDSEFVELYETIYDDLTDVKNITDPSIKKCLQNIEDSDQIRILIGGCGINKMGSYLKKKYDQVICVDDSEQMLLKAQEKYPECKYIHGDLRDRKLFQKGEFSHIFLDERVLNYYPKKEMNTIIENCNSWLADQGFLIVPIYYQGKLGVASRYYSTNYYDDQQNLHGFTYLHDFAHDCYYIQNKENKNMYHFFDKIVLDNGKKRVKQTDFYFYPKEDMYSMFVKKYFKVFAIEPYQVGKQVLGGYDVAIFRKEKAKMDISEVQRKYDV